MTTEQEKQAVENIAKAARRFISSYDEFDGDPSCCGEDLNGLFDACDEFGKVADASDPSEVTILPAYIG